MEENIKRTHYIFEENYRNLVRHLRQAQKLSLRDGSKETLSKSDLEALRLLHNFISSSRTLMDHHLTYNRKKGLATIRPFVNNLFYFIHDLRNLMIHEGNPNLIRSIKKIGGKRRILYRLDKGELAKFSEKWKKESKYYLSSKPKKISLIGVLGVYRHFINEYYGWDIS